MMLSMLIYLTSGGEMTLSSMSILTLYLTTSLFMVSQTNFTPTLFAHNTMVIMDSLSWSLLTLTMFIMPTMIMSNITLLKYKTFMFTVNTLILVLMMSFSLHNLLLYYIMFESTILPTVVLIMLFGYQPERLLAGLYIMMYTMVASLPLLLSILLNKSPINFFMVYYHLTYTSNLVLWSLILAFLVKTPIYLTHMWLPKAHVEAPVAGSIVLAGILLKLGIYAIMRLKMSYYNIEKIMLPIISLALWGSCLAGFVCIRQTDMKCLIANSSVAHMGLGLVGSFISTSRGWIGAILLLVSHGLTSSMLFFLGGAYYQTTKTRSLPLMLGMHLMLPTMTICWCSGMISNSSIPPTLNMMGELLLIMAAYSFSISWLMHIMIQSMVSLLYSSFLFIMMHHGETSKTKFTHSNKLNLLLWALFMTPQIILTPSHPLLSYNLAN